MERWLDWLSEHEAWLVWTGIGSVVLLVASLLLLPVLVGALPADHFVHRRRLRESRHPIVRVARNAGGALLILMGLAMLVLPGQGLLTLIAGLTLLEFPGKRALEIRLARRPRILAALNWLRARRKAEPFVAPPPRPGDGAPG